MTDTTNKKANKLINETSPYLLQHAYNPVQWHAWGKEAFEKATKENKPIFLSIGYSTCHWCHVMEHESFEDEEVAAAMNEKFVSIKVDREERPDIDNIYMNVCQMMTRSGGWPLTIIMTPDKKPFFAGTYFPKYSRSGRIGMMDLLVRIDEIWRNNTKEALDSAEQITKILHQISEEVHVEKIDESVMQRAYEHFVERFDSQYGGFGSAPKFPSPHNFLFLLRFWKRTKNQHALEMVEKSLQSMRRGGVYDHIGYGLHRYSTDSKWLVPHFEKMLYDQSMLSIACIETYQVTKNDEYKNIAKEIFSYVLRDMTSEEGGFYSAEDADSEGEEGKFYVWTLDEIKNILTKEESELAIKIFNLSSEGNYLEESTREITGNNILHLTESLVDIANKLDIPESQLKPQLEVVRKKLFEYRIKRIHPHKDKKILTSWNGLMIAALAKGSQVFGESEYALAAVRAVDFIFNKMHSAEKLLHCYCSGKVTVDGHLDDYAFLIWGLLELYEATFEIKYLKFAIELNTILLKHFWDHKNGGFYFTADYDKDLIVRQKEIYDGAIPSGNSVAMLNLLKIGEITGDSNLKEKAEKIMSAFSANLKQAPIAHTQLLAAVDYLAGPSCEIILTGNLKSENSQSMLNIVRNEFLPNKIILFKENDELSKIADYTNSYKCVEGRTTVYICKNYNCNLPLTDTNEVKKLLTST